jgi:hypothetical protein
MISRVLILRQIRSVYRLIEFALGIQGYPFTHEWIFYVFESLPMLPAISVFCVWHPAEYLGGGWRKGRGLVMFSWRTAVAERTCDLDLPQVDNLTFTGGVEEFGSVVLGMLLKFGVSSRISRIIDCGTELLNRNFQALRSSYVAPFGP